MFVISEGHKHKISKLCMYLSPSLAISEVTDTNEQS